MTGQLVFPNSPPTYCWVCRRSLMPEESTQTGRFGCGEWCEGRAENGT